MRVNERVEELKKFFYNDDYGREFFDVHHFINRVIAPQAKSNVRGDYHPVWQGEVTPSEGFRYYGALWQSGSVSNRLISAHAMGKRPLTDKKGPIHVDARYEEEGGSRKAIDFHVPVDFTQRRDGASKFAFSVISDGRAPLLTIAKLIPERGKPHHVVLTSHSVEGHKLAELLARRLRGIATQLRDEEGRKLPQPGITLVAGNNVDLPEEKRRPTRRETAQKGREAFAKLPDLERKTRELEVKLARKEAQAARNARLVRALIRQQRTLKGEVAVQEGIKKEKIARLADHEAKLREIEQETKAGFGKRRKALENIRRIAGSAKR